MYKLFQKSQKGFTLIEMLVSVTIMVLLIGGGIAGYINFNDKRVILSAVGELKAEFASAQSLANSGRLGGCDILNGYRISSAGSGTDTIVSIDVNCLTGSTDGSQDYTVELDGVNMSNVNVLYRVLNSGICLDGDCADPNPEDIDITVENINGNGGIYEFSVNEGGQISEGGWQ